MMAFTVCGWDSPARSESHFDIPNNVAASQEAREAFTGNTKWRENEGGAEERRGPGEGVVSSSRATR